MDNKSFNVSFITTRDALDTHNEGKLSAEEFFRPILRPLFYDTLSSVLDAYRQRPRPKS